MDYKISVEHSSPTGIIGILSYYDVGYGVALSRRAEDGEAVFRIFKSRNNSAPGDLRLAMDEDGSVREFVMRDGTEENTATPITIATIKAETVSQGEFLKHIADVLTTL